MSDIQPVRDARGRFVPGSHPGVGAPPITPDNAHLMLARRREKKQQAIMEAANVVARLDASQSQHPEIRALVQPDDDMAFIKAIAIGRTKAAMDSDSPYGTASANWITEHAGLAESRQAEPQPGATITLSLGADALDAVRMLLDAVARSQRDVVDGQVVDSE